MLCMAVGCPVLVELRSAKQLQHSGSQGKLNKTIPVPASRSDGDFGKRVANVLGLYPINCLRLIQREERALKNKTRVLLSVDVVHGNTMCATPRIIVGRNCISHLAYFLLQMVQLLSPL